MMAAGTDARHDGLHPRREVRHAPHSHAGPGTEAPAHRERTGAMRRRRSAAAAARDGDVHGSSGQHDGTGRCPLPAEWRSLASVLRERAAAEGAAIAYERAARELEEWETDSENALLTLAEAAARVGRSSETIRKRIGTAELPNYGKRNAPRVRAADVLRALPLRRLSPRGNATYDLDADVRSLLASRGGR